MRHIRYLVAMSAVVTAVTLAEACGAAGDPSAGDDSPPTEDAAQPTPAPGCSPADAVMELWDGATLDGWAQAGPGGFDIIATDTGPVLQSRGGLGMLWYQRRGFGDAELTLDWQVTTETDNSGVFLRFPDPGSDPWVAVDNGYEVQIYDGPDGDPQKTGAIYNEQQPVARNSAPVGEWNTYRIRAEGDRYQVWLNDVLVNDYRGTKPTVGREGFIGLQNHDPSSRVRFRDIRIRPLTGC